MVRVQFSAGLTWSVRPRGVFGGVHMRVVSDSIFMNGCLTEAAGTVGPKFRERGFKYRSTLRLFVFPFVSMYLEILLRNFPANVPKCSFKRTSFIVCYHLH